MSTTLRIIPAANTCLYLPVYLAVNWRLFEKFSSTGEYDVRLENTQQGVQGDQWAIKQLPQNDDAVLALCDPMEVVNVGGLRDLQGMRILGSFIKKPCFWAINQCDELQQLEDVQHFLGVVRSIDRMQTGHYFGGLLHDKIEERYRTRVPATDAQFGQEIAQLLTLPDNGKNYCGVTADLLGCEVASRIGPSKVFYSFPKDARFEEFVTSGFVVRAGALDRHREFLTNFMSAVSLACSIIDAAPESIAPILAQLADAPAYKQQSYIGSPNAQVHWKDPAVRRGVIEGVWRRLVNERVYDPHISISKNAWNNALMYRAIAADRREAASSLYETIVVRDLTEEAIGRADGLLTRGRMKQLVETVETLDSRVAELEKIANPLEGSIGATGFAIPKLPALAAMIFVGLLVGSAAFFYLNRAWAWQFGSAPNTIGEFLITFVSTFGAVSWLRFYTRVVGPLKIGPGAHVSAAVRLFATHSGMIIAISIAVGALFVGVPLWLHQTTGKPFYHDLFEAGMTFDGVVLAAILIPAVHLFLKKHITF